MPPRIFSAARDLTDQQIDRQPLGALAQLGERLNGIQEVNGSIPLGSTFQGDSCISE